MSGSCCFTGAYLLAAAANQNSWSVQCSFVVVVALFPVNLKDKKCDCYS